MLLLSIFGMTALAEHDLARTKEKNHTPEIGCRAYVSYQVMPESTPRHEVFQMERCSDALPIGQAMAIRHYPDPNAGNAWVIRYIPMTRIHSVTVQQVE